MINLLFALVNIKKLKILKIPLFDNCSKMFNILGHNASLNIEVDPRHPTMLPECCFLGADHGMKIKI